MDNVHAYALSCAVAKGTGNIQMIRKTIRATCNGIQYYSHVVSKQELQSGKEYHVDFKVYNALDFISPICQEAGYVIQDKSASQIDKEQKGFLLDTIRHRLKGMSFAQLDLSYVDIRGITFDTCDFTNADLSKALIEDTYFINCNVMGCRISREQASMPYFYGSSMENADVIDN